MNRNMYGWRLYFLSFCVAGIMACTASAQTWVASTGTVDPSSLMTYSFSGAAAFVRGNTPGKVVLRYNILPTDEMLVNVTQPCCEGRALPG